MTRLYPARGGQQLTLVPGAKAPHNATYARRGMEFEKELNALHAQYKALGVAVIEKNYVPSQPVKDGRWAMVIGKAIVDYTGLTQGGRFVAFDAKDVEGTRIALSMLQDHQLSYLGSVKALGGMAFVLVRFGGKYVYRIPVDIWADAEVYHTFGEYAPRVDGWRPTHKASLCLEDMRPQWRVDGLDYLGVCNREQG